MPRDELPGPRAPGPDPDDDGHACIRQERTVLVCENDADLGRLIAGTLSSAGYEVISMRMPSDAVAYALESRRPIDLLVTDLRLPEMPGDRLVDAMREVCGSYLCVLRISDDVPDEVDETGELLVRPFSEQDLLRSVHRCLA